MKKLAFTISTLSIAALILMLSLVACGKDSKESQLEKETEAAKTQFGKMVEESKRVAEDIEAQAKEQAEDALNAAEDAMDEASVQIDEVKEDIKGAIE